eukprot:scaffold2195_cov127-Isochrysis_galbana.AAC.2
MFASRYGTSKPDHMRPSVVSLSMAIQCWTGPTSVFAAEAPLTATAGTPIPRGGGGGGDE